MTESMNIGNIIVDLSGFVFTSDFFLFRMFEQNVAFWRDLIQKVNIAKKL